MFAVGTVCVHIPPPPPLTALVSLSLKILTARSCHAGITAFICCQVMIVGLLPIGAIISASLRLILPPGTNLATYGRLSGLLGSM